MKLDLPFVPSHRVVRNGATVSYIGIYNKTTITKVTSKRDNSGAVTTCEWVSSATHHATHCEQAFSKKKRIKTHVDGEKHWSTACSFKTTPKRHCLPLSSNNENVLKIFSKHSNINFNINYFISSFLVFAMKEIILLSAA